MQMLSSCKTVDDIIRLKREGIIRTPQQPQQMAQNQMYPQPQQLYPNPYSMYPMGMQGFPPIQQYAYNYQPTPGMPQNYNNYYQYPNPQQGNYAIPPMNPQYNINPGNMQSSMFNQQINAQQINANTPIGPNQNFGQNNNLPNSQIMSQPFLNNSQMINQTQKPQLPESQNFNNPMYNSQNLPNQFGQQFNPNINSTMNCPNPAS